MNLPQFCSCLSRAAEAQGQPIRQQDAARVLALACRLLADMRPAEIVKILSDGLNKAIRKRTAKTIKKGP